MTSDPPSPSSGSTSAPAYTASRNSEPADGAAAKPPIFPANLDINVVPPELKNEGSDWFAVFNADVKRVLDVSLVHTLVHSRSGTSRKSASGTYSTATSKNSTQSTSPPAVGSGDKTVRIWDMLDGSSKVLAIDNPDLLNDDTGVTSVAISPNGRLVAAGSLDCMVYIWDITTVQLVDRLHGHDDSVYSLAFTPDGKGLVSGSLDKTMKY
ncbi:hypothetical protein H0H81_004867 [Sphagnurus paluster]|uniref:WD40 repeat-like protein n=1 Tax=Sphagnurus paluster TaxID=117069 RepID=A0A9P7FU95_9AGAR|nr:hypothetical protein H0H81_004867 [Sphagnurus paluster]